MSVLIDTSGLFALADSDDAAHPAVRGYIDGTSEALLVPATVLTESDYLVANRLGLRVEQSMLRAITTGAFQLVDLTLSDLVRCLDLIEQYSDSNIGLVDASLVAIAERLRITRILTLDARHFRMFRPVHCGAFDLVP